MAQRERLLQYGERYNALKAELQAIGFLCQGSVQTRRTECGKATCRCHEAPENRHGPYHYWTRKARGKTVGLMLTEDELALYREGIQNNRHVERILRDMRTLSTRALALTTGRKAP
jgi:hypothetical protein